MTSQILRLQQHYEKLPYEKRGKVRLKELIEKRKKYLKEIRNKDYPLFEYLIEKLNIVYKSFPE